MVLLFLSLCSRDLLSVSLSARIKIQGSTCLCWLGRQINSTKDKGWSLLVTYHRCQLGVVRLSCTPWTFGRYSENGYMAYLNRCILY
jgi:hypothetical protein